MARKVKSKKHVGAQFIAPVLEYADEMLATIVRYSIRLDEAEAAYQADLQAVKDRHQDVIVGLQDSMATFNGDLLELMKKNSGAIFEGEERVELKHGSLLFTIEERVVKARGVLKKLEELGLEDALEISKKVKWDELEKWPVERLVLVGTKKKRKEIYTYEVKTLDSGSSPE